MDAITAWNTLTHQEKAYLLREFRFDLWACSLYLTKENPYLDQVILFLVSIGKAEGGSLAAIALAVFQQGTPEIKEALARLLAAEKLISEETMLKLIGN